MYAKYYYICISDFKNKKKSRALRSCKIIWFTSITKYLKKEKENRFSILLCALLSVHANSGDAEAKNNKCSTYVTTYANVYYTYIYNTLYRKDI